MFGNNWRSRSEHESKPEWNELNEKLKAMEKQLDTLSHRNVVYHIHVQNLHVHHPKLEQLAFRLDQLDIKELSGSLNLGNNFGAGEPRIKEWAASQTPSSHAEAKNSYHNAPDASAVRKHAKGYTYTFGSKAGEEQKKEEP